MDSTALIPVQYGLDTFYFLICGALVMWMAAGFSMLEAGLVRAKNTAEILTKNIVLFALASIMYLLIGYYYEKPAASDAAKKAFVVNRVGDFAFILGFLMLLAAQYPGVHRLLLNKYYVDEVYDATIVQPIKVVSTEGLWRGFDVKVVDGAVNGAGYLVSGVSIVLRLVQNGSVKTYAAAMFVGTVAILAYYLWR